MSKQVPDWLDAEAKRFWKKHIHHLHLKPDHVEGFTLLCQTYSDYRSASDLRERRTYLDIVIKLMKEYGMTPKSKKINPDETQDELDQFLTEDNHG